MPLLNMKTNMDKSESGNQNEKYSSYPSLVHHFSLRFNGNFPGEPRQPLLLNLRSDGDNWSYVVQNSSQLGTTNKQKPNTLVHRLTEAFHRLLPDL